MNDTMSQIQKLELERHELYKLAAHNKITPKQRDRIPQLASELNLLWDQHRREDAARRWGPRSMTQPKTNSDTSAA